MTVFSEKMEMPWKILINIGVLAVIAGATWFLTGLDKTSGGESKRGHHLTRALRCVAILFLAAFLLLLLEQRNLSPGDLPLIILCPIIMALILRSSVTELFTQGCLGMLDPAFRDQRPLDLHKTQRYQDTIAHLIHTGQQADAIKLCEQLKQSGELDRSILEHTLEFLGVKQSHPAHPPPLVEAARLRAEGKFSAAERLLQSLLEKNRADEGAAIMLMRLYTQDLRQPERALDVLHALEKQPHVSRDHLDFARRSLDEWSRPQSEAAEAADPAGLADRAFPAFPAPLALPPSVDNLIAQRSLGTAVELLEEQIQARPDDFSLRMKLAEVHAVHCKNLRRAENIIQQLRGTGSFTPQQAAWAQDQLKQWRAACELPRGAT